MRKGAVQVVDISDLPTSRNLVELFLRRADARGDAPFLWAKREGKWQPISWAEAARQVDVLLQGGLGAEPQAVHLLHPLHRRGVGQFELAGDGDRAVCS